MSRKHRPKTGKKPPQNIIGTEGNDSFNLGNSYSTVKALGGNDRIQISNRYALVFAGAGDDNVFTGIGAHFLKVYGGEGNDTIENGNNNRYGGDDAKLYGEAGDDYIFNRSYNKSGDVYKSIVDGGEGNDTIRNGDNSNKVVINGGAGNDIIESQGESENITITGGIGNDSISLSGNSRNVLIQYNSGEGNDTIQGFNASSTLKIGDGTGTYSTLNDNSDVMVFAGDGVILLKGAANLSSLNIQGTKSTVTPTFNGTDGDDSIDNRLSHSTIDAGNGNDTIDNSGSNILINAGAGNDVIYNSGSNVSINAGAANDDIHNSGENVTIAAGNGYDRITLTSGAKNNLIEYNASDDKDTIWGFNETSTLKIGDGTGTYRPLIGNSDVTVFAGNNGIVLKDAASLSSLNIQGTKTDVTLTIKGTGGGNDSINNNFSNVILDGGGGKDTITNSGSDVSIDAGNGDDTISNSGSNVSINAGAGKDSISLSSGATNNLIQYNSGDGNDVITGFNSTSTLQIGDGTGTYSTVTENSDVTVFVGNNAVVLKDAANLSSLNIQGTKIEGTPTISGTNGDDSITGNFSNVIINGGAGNDSVSLGSGATNNLIQYNSGDGNDTVFGFKENSTLKIGDGTDTYSTVSKNSDVTVFVGNNAVVLKDAANLSSLNIQGTKIEGTPTIKSENGSVNNKLSDVIIAGGADNDSIYNSGERVTINGGEGNDSIGNSYRGGNVIINGDAGDDNVYNGGHATINGGAGNDSINNWGSSVTINAGEGNDSVTNSHAFVTINGGAGNDYIYSNGYRVIIDGGAGDDQIQLSKNSTANVIQYKAGDGNDTISNFDKNDTLAIASDSYSTVINGNDVIVTVGEGKVTLEGAASLSSVNIVNSTYANFTIRNSKVTYESDILSSIIARSYRFSAKNSLLTLNDNLKNYTVTVKNEDESAKMNWYFGTATLNNGSTLEYQKLNGQKNNLTLTSKKYDKFHSAKMPRSLTAKLEWICSRAV